MLIDDRVYGINTIQKQVLIELINSKPLQRLKGINQAGASFYTVKGKDENRFEHSVGVMLLLKYLGASTEEQVAGLVHDISHMAFSHVIDYVVGNLDETYHEEFFEKIILNSEIPEIIKRHGFRLDRLLDESNFGLLERNIPDLCADRIDYTLRAMARGKQIPNDKIKQYLENLVVVDNEIFFNEINIGRNFAEDYLNTGENNWSHPVEVATFQLMANALKIAFEKGILSEIDMFGDDNSVYNKLLNSKNNEILKILNRLNYDLHAVEDTNNFDFYSKNKIRYVDPKIVSCNFKRVSDIYPEFKKRLDEHNNKIRKGFFLRIIN